MGRPSLKSEAVITEICERLSKGEPLAAICRDEHMPSHVTVWNWSKDDDAVAEAIARARDTGEYVIAADCLAIADDARNDWMERNGGDDPGWAANGEHIQRSKLRIDTRLKLLAKWNPKRWGDKIDHNVTGGITVNLESRDDRI